jgi:hypothetical protein
MLQPRVDPKVRGRRRFQCRLRGHEVCEGGMIKLIGVADLAEELFKPTQRLGDLGAAASGPAQPQHLVEGEGLLGD